MPIKRVEVTFETITPLFLGGVNPQGPPELRPASIRGVLRWWLRARTGALGDGEHAVTLGDVRRGETGVFGETEQASPVIVRVQEPPGVDLNFVRPERSALNYLWYGLHTREGRGRDVQIRYRPPFRVGERFKVVLQTRPSRTTRHDHAFEQACAALWLTATLGGLGARSRRGTGIIAARSFAGDWPESLPDPRLDHAGSPSELLTGLEQGLRAIHGPSRSRYPRPLPYPNLRPDRYTLVVFDRIWDDWETALATLGESFRSFRSRRDPDYGRVRDFIQTGRMSQTVERAAFGLPLPFFYRSLGGSKATVEGKGFDRAASPLRFRLWPLESGKFAAGFILFRAPLLPPRDGRLALRGPRGRADAPVPSQKIITDFLQATMTTGDDAYIGTLLEVRP